MLQPTVFPRKLLEDTSAFLEVVYEAMVRHLAVAGYAMVCTAYRTPSGFMPRDVDYRKIQYGPFIAFWWDGDSPRSV